MLSLLMVVAATATTPALEKLLTELSSQAPEEFTAERGREVWYRQHGQRSCTSCHTDSPHSSGRHQRTGKVIGPMAPSVDPKRLTDLRKMNKWLLRNCKWTFGRECTVQERGDVLVWLREQ